MTWSAPGHGTRFTYRHRAHGAGLRPPPPGLKRPRCPTPHGVPARTARPQIDAGVAAIRAPRSSGVEPCVASTIQASPSRRMKLPFWARASRIVAFTIMSARSKRSTSGSASARMTWLTAVS